MTNQAKRLRDYLKANNLKGGIGPHARTPRVRTRRNQRCINGQRFTEWGSANATAYVALDKARAVEEAARHAGFKVYAHWLTDFALIYFGD